MSLMEMTGVIFPIASNRVMCAGSRIDLFVICSNCTIPCTLTLSFRFTLVDAEDN